MLTHGAMANRLGVLNQAVSQSGVPIPCVEMLLKHGADVNGLDAVRKNYDATIFPPYSRDVAV